MMKYLMRSACVALVGLSVACASMNGGSDTQPVGTSGTVSGQEPVPASGRQDVVPVDQLLDVRLRTRLSSENANVEDRFETTTVADLMQGSDVLIPAGSRVRGVVTSVDRASRLDRTGKLTLSFDQITVRGREYPIRAMATQAFESEGLKGEAPKIGIGAGVGAIVGGILGGLKGALAGVLIGGGGTIVATEGKDAVLPAGTIVRIRFDSALQLRSTT